MNISKDIFKPNGEVYYLPLESNKITCSEEMAKEVLIKLFLDEYPFSETWFDSFLKVLFEMELVMKYKPVYFVFQDVQIPTGLVRIILNPKLVDNMYQIKEIPEETKKEVFQKLLEKLKEESHEASHSH